MRTLISKRRKIELFIGTRPLLLSLIILWQMVCCTILFAGESEFIKNITDVNILRKLDWGNVNSIEKLANNFWTPYKGKQDYSGSEVLKEGFIKINDTDFHVMLHRDNTKIVRPFLVVIVALSFPKGKDDEMIDWATEQYGKQYVAIDDSMSSSSSQRMYSKTIQWELEGTIVEFSSLAHESSDKKYTPAFLAFRCGAKENIKKIKPYIYISCSQKLSNELVEKDLGEVLLIIDENKGRLLNSRKFPLEAKATVNDDFVAFVAEGEKTNNEVYIHETSIDRQSGALRGKLKSRKKLPNGEYGEWRVTNIEGQCRKVEPEKKF